MDKSDNQIIIGNKKEKNIKQILDKDNKNISENDKQNEKINQVKANENNPKEQKKPKLKGYVKVFRNYLKKKIPQGKMSFTIVL